MTSAEIVTASNAELQACKLRLLGFQQSGRATQAMRDELWLIATEQRNRAAYAASKTA